MRALILAAGLGQRMRPLSMLCPKPAMPVRDLPVIAYLLALLRTHGVREVMVNLHHLGDRMRAAAEQHCPQGLGLHFSHEPALLGTGGAIRRVADFLRESDPSLVLGGDMILDADLAGLASRQRARGDRVTLLLRRDPRGSTFGTIGVDAGAGVRRIGRRFDLGGEKESGVFVSVRAFSPRAFDSLPARDCFEDLSDWLAPQLAAGARDIRGELWDADRCTWEPVGTPREYLRANLEPTRLSYWNADAIARAGGARFEPDLVIGAGAQLGADAHLERAVVWPGERVPAGLWAQDGVFAGGQFHPVVPGAGAGSAATT